MLKQLDTLLAACIGFVITYLFTHHSGIGVCPDAIAYVSASRNIVNLHQLTDYMGRPFIDFPAGYPMFLSGLLRLTHIDPFHFTPLLNPLLFALLIILCGSVAGRLKGAPAWYKPLVLICIALSPALIEVYIMLWSETLFIILMILFMIFMERYLCSHKISALLAAAILCAISCTVRYVGVTLIGTGGLLILLERYPTFLRKLGHLCLFGIIAVSLIVLNFACNYHVSGTLMGKRQAGITPLFQNIYYYGNTLSGWFFYGVEYYWLCVILGIMVLAILIFLIIRILRRTSKETYPTFIRVTGMFSIVYSAFMIISATLSRYESLNSRLLSPLYIPLVFSVAWIFVRKTDFRWKAVIGVGFLLIFTTQLRADYQWYSDIRDAGIGGYTEDIWPKSPLVQYIRQKPSPFLPGYTLYSNAPEALYFFADMQCQLLPQQAYPEPIQQFYAADHQYLIWFNDMDDGAILTLNQVLAHKQMTLLKQFSDGAIYITAK